MKLIFSVPPEADGALLRNFLRMCAVSTELARAVKFHGSGFFAEGEPILANRRVAAGQDISFELPEDGAGVAPQPEIPVKVVYGDAFAIVLEKPPHLAVHPTLNYPLGTLANGYAALMETRGESPVFRPVNRIDKDTSGLVLAAKNAYAAPLLARNVEKRYDAIAEGELPLGKGVIDAPIGRQAESSIGHPLAGDDLYGGSREKIGRQALHCASQTFRVPRHTVTPESIRVQVPGRDEAWQTVTVESPLPPDMKALLG